MDSQGNVLFTGTFQGQLNWEGPNGTAITLRSENYAAFFVKYSATNPRTILWASQVVEQARFALPMLNIVAGCKPDARYSLVLIGDSNRFGGQRHLNGSIHRRHIGTLQFFDIFLSSFLKVDNVELYGQLHENNIYLIKLDQNGYLSWGIPMKGTAINVCNAIAVNMNTNDIYAAGYYAKKLLVSDTTILDSNYLNFYLAKFNSEGQLQWYHMPFCAKR